MNAYDSSKIADVLTAQGTMEVTQDIQKADLVVLNTCSIRDKAQEKVFSELGRWNLLKKKKPGLLIAVGGCVASQEGAAMIKRAPYVDVVFGPQTLHRLPQLLEQRAKTRKPAVDISFPEIEKFDYLPPAGVVGPTAMVSIMEGCSKYCSYCVVPYTRGEEISRPFDDVLAEVAALADRGVREVTLLGQNVNDYRGAMHGGGTADLALLIHYIAAMDTILRIRFTTSHPVAFSDALIQAYAEEPKLANHLHLPVQSGSDRILAQMKRGYTVLEYKSKIRKLRKVRPDISITSDFIVGFPGETDDDFEATLNLINEIQFDHSYSFIFSRRPGTPAASLLDTMPMEEKKRRLNILQNRLLQQETEISRSMLGRTQHVLVAGVSLKNPEELTGRGENNQAINFIGPASLIGTLAPVKITEALRNSLRGVLLS